jgi:glutathione peroxidase-family protein
MKILLTCLFLIIQPAFPSVYQFSLTGMDQEPIHLSDYKGKKIVILTLPNRQTGADSTFLKELDSLNIEYLSRIQIIAVPSIEDGYGSRNMKSLLSIATILSGRKTIVTQPVYTYPQSKKNQSLLFAWLMDRRLNGHLDQKEFGPGTRYFIDENGELYGLVSGGVRVGKKGKDKLLMRKRDK